MRLVAAFVCVALSLGAARSHAQETDREMLSELGGYERAALERALAERHLAIEGDPEGKRIGRVIVVNLDVFGEDEGFLTWLNFLHVTTREHVIAREVLLESGDMWDAELAEESRRRLAEPLFTSLVVVAPVVSSQPGHVDLLVVTRDIWSLRMNSQFEFQEREITELSISISENNLFGYRKQVATVFDMDQGAYSLGPQYIDKNIAGTRLQLATKLGAIFSRDESEFEGTRSYTSFGYPLWSLDTKWGAGVIAQHYDSRVRLFRGTSLRTYDDPETDEIEALPWTYDYRSVDLESYGVRSFGDQVKHRVYLGHRLEVRRPSFADDFPGDQAERAAFRRDVFPRSERSSAVFARYTLFTPEYVVYRDLDSYDLAEDARLGPEVEAEVGFALEPLGSERNFTTLSAGAAWTFDIAGDGYVRLSTGAAGRVESGDLIDKIVSGTVSGASPRVADLFRVVGRLSAARRLEETANRFYVLGGDSGLRGYEIGAFTGQIRWVGNLEVRSMPVPLLFTRVGGLLFYDVGHAADTLDELSLRSDIGVGARMLIPQLQSVVFRLDWAIPLQSSEAGLPGRISAGVAQVF